VLPRNIKKNYCTDDGTLKPEHSNDITRLVTNEFMFYTKVPLSMEEFGKFQQKLYDLAAAQPENLHLVLGSFAVRTPDNKVMNVVPHIECGSSPKINFIVKNYPSDVDPTYSEVVDGERKILLNFDKEKGDNPESYEIVLNGQSHKLSFNNIFECQAFGGGKFYSCVDICSDFSRGVAKENLIAKLRSEGKAEELDSIQVTHIVTSNPIPLKGKEAQTLAPITHADPASSHITAKQGITNTNKETISSLGFGTELNVTVTQSAPCALLPNAVKEAVIRPETKPKPVQTSNEPLNVNIENFIHKDLQKDKGTINSSEYAAIVAAELKQMNLDLFAAVDLEELKRELKGEKKAELKAEKKAALANETDPKKRKTIEDDYATKIAAIVPLNLDKLKKLPKNCTLLTNVIVVDILHATSQKHQKNIYEFYVDVMKNSFELGDIETAAAIANALQAGPIDRLKYLKSEASGKLLGEIERVGYLKGTELESFTTKLQKQGIAVVHRMAPTMGALANLAGIMVYKDNSSKKTDNIDWDATDKQQAEGVGPIIDKLIELDKKNKTVDQHKDNNRKTNFSQKMDVHQDVSENDLYKISGNILERGATEPDFSKAPAYSSPLMSPLTEEKTFIKSAYNVLKAMVKKFSAGLRNATYKTYNKRISNSQDGNELDKGQIKSDEGLLKAEPQVATQSKLRTSDKVIGNADGQPPQQEIPFMSSVTPEQYKEAVEKRNKQAEIRSTGERATARIINPEHHNKHDGNGVAELQGLIKKALEKCYELKQDPRMQDTLEKLRAINVDVEVTLLQKEHPVNVREVVEQLKPLFALVKTVQDENKDKMKNIEGDKEENDTYRRS